MVRENRTGTVYILGAGASCFAGFPLARSLLHFLKHDFETTREVPVRVWGEKFLDFVQRVMPHVPDRWKYDNNAADLEFILALVDRIRQRGCQTDLLRSNNLLEDLDTIIHKLDLENRDLSQVESGGRMLVTSAFLNHSYVILDRVDRDVQVKQVVDAWAKCINPGDCIITSNWDLLHELILYGTGKWHYLDGYGVDLSPGSQKFSSVLTLKLHGSVNWPLRHSSDALSWIDYVPQFFHHSQDDDLNDTGSHHLGATADLGESLILPSYLKSPRNLPVLNDIWEKAKIALEETTDVIVFGYSLPAGDYDVYDMVCKALRRNQNVRSVQLFLKNDTKAFERWEGLCDKAGKRDVVRRIQTTFERFLAADP